MSDRAADGLAGARLAAGKGLSFARGSRGRFPAVGQAPAALAFLAVLAVLERSAPRAGSDIALLSLIPVIYTALYGRNRRSLYIVLAGVAVFYLAPIALPRPVNYPAAVLAVLVTSTIGLVTQSLVSDMRRQAADAGRRERMLEQVSGVVRELFDSEEPRTDICRATLDISGARVAILFEPELGHRALRSTAIAGAQTVTEPIVAGPETPIAAAMRTGSARLLTAPIARPVDPVSEACGSADSVMYQPLLRGDVAAGVLVVGWDDGVPVNAARQAVVALLAHEAALVIGRADELALLTDMAETDALTGLPNRRAWDARLNRAADDGEQVTIAMLDIDHFKRFNDDHGHPAGDRLLRDTAAAWRDLLRAGDLLARVGGEEFGLLLVNCSPAGAAEVAERLRQAITDGQTASAGLAVPRPGEPLESVMGRADHALYEAKASGRNQSRTAA